MSAIPSMAIPRPRLVVGAIAFLASTVQFFVAQIVVGAAWTTPYSWSRNWISDLGNTRCGSFQLPHGAPYEVCSPLHGVMNASFIAAGVLFVVGVVCLWRLAPRRALSVVALVLLLIAGVCKAIVGLAPENTNIGLHLIGAAGIPIGGIGILLFSIALRRTRPGLGILGIVVGIVTVVAAFLSTATQYGIGAAALGLGDGGMERLADYPAFLWMVCVAIAALSSPARLAARTPLAVSPER